MRVCPCSKMKYQLLNCLVLSRLHSAQTCTILPVLPGSCIIHPSLHLTIIAACFTWTRLPLTTVLFSSFSTFLQANQSHTVTSVAVSCLSLPKAPFSLNLLWWAICHFFYSSSLRISQISQMSCSSLCLILFILFCCPPPPRLLLLSKLCLLSDLH